MHNLILFQVSSNWWNNNGGKKKKEQCAKSFLSTLAKIYEKLQKLLFGKQYYY